MGGYDRRTPDGLQRFALALRALNREVAKPGDDFVRLDEGMVRAGRLDHEKLSPLVRDEHRGCGDAGGRQLFRGARRDDAAVPFLDPPLYVPEGLEVCAALRTVRMYGDEHGREPAGLPEGHGCPAIGRLDRDEWKSLSRLERGRRRHVTPPSMLPSAVAAVHDERATRMPPDRRAASVLQRR